MTDTRTLNPYLADQVFPQRLQGFCVDNQYGLICSRVAASHHSTRFSCVLAHRCHHTCIESATIKGSNDWFLLERAARNDQRGFRHAVTWKVCLMSEAAPGELFSEHLQRTGANGLGTIERYFPGRQVQRLQFFFRNLINA